MIWPFSAIARKIEEKAVLDAMSAEEKLKLARQRIALKNAQQATKTLTMMKKIVIFCLVNGVAWVWCSYILAFLGHDAIAESLSQVALAEIVGVVLVYAIKSVIENLSSHNQWPDKFPGVADGIEIDTEYTFEGEVGTDNEEDYIGG